MINKKKIGLALGGGGAKGYAHIGVIKALEAAGIEIDYIAGTSMGALVGGYYAATKDVKKLEELALKIKRSDLFPVREIIKFKKDGALFRGQSVADALNHHLSGIKIENCQIPFAAVATDVRNGDEFAAKSGDLTTAIRASIAVPAVFSPVEINGQFYMDGGLANPVPANVVRQMGADYVIAVDVSSKWMTAPEELVSVKDIYAIMSNALSIIEYQIAKGILKDNADIVLRPPVLTYDWTAFDRAGEIIKVGQKELELNLKEIRRQTGRRAPRRTMGEKFFDFIINKPEH
jgi:NTE family protein